MIKEFVLRVLNRLARMFDLSIVQSQSLLLTYQHDYGSGSYEAYKRTQIFHNKRKIDQVFADDLTLKTIADYVNERVGSVSAGICHGTRRGYEQAEFSRLLGCPVLGTEISDTADQFPNTVEWDFHEQKPEWRDAFSFVYSNSLDQAFDPKKALSTWVAQLEPNGLLFIEHTMAHAAAHASDMDPFGAHPTVMPYLLFRWGKGQYELVDILELTHPQKKRLWIFVVGRTNTRGHETNV